MQVFKSFESFRNWFALQPNLQRTIVTIGSFDGLHVGHRYMLEELMQWSRDEGCMPLVITFGMHPRTFMTGVEIKRILPLDQKLELLDDLGIGAAIAVDFDEQLQNMSAPDFSRNLLVDLCSAKGVLLGHNNAFGHNREGTPERIREIGKELGFSVRVAGALEVDRKPISSTAIRSAIEEADFLLARQMLGRTYSILARVEKGKALGRTIGFPTANLALEGLVHPKAGVYGVRVRFGEERLVGAANIGTRPTVEDRRQSILEVHLLDYTGDLYGKELEVEFIFHVRAEMKFAGLDELKAQIANDVELIQSKLQTTPHSSESNLWQRIERKDNDE